MTLSPKVKKFLELAMDGVITPPLTLDSPSIEALTDFTQDKENGFASFTEEECEELGNMINAAKVTDTFVDRMGDRLLGEVGLN